MFPAWELILRIAVGAVLGGIIGLERDIHGRPVGFRTHMIVAMAAATFMVVSGHFVYYQHYSDADHVTIDTSRIAASVVTGIGFLAAGAILRTGATVQGLTTAAALWLVTAIGLCAGSGMYVIAAAVTIMGLVALAALRLFEGRNSKVHRREIWLEMTGGPASVRRILGRITQSGVALSEFDYGKTLADNKVQMSFEAKMPNRLVVEDLIQKIEEDPEVLQIKIRIPK